jgi:hypothetical protein
LRREFEPGSAAIEGVAAVQRGSRVLISNNNLRTHCRTRQWVFVLPIAGRPESAEIICSKTRRKNIGRTRQSFFLTGIGPTGD